MANQAVLEKVLADEEFVKGLAEMENPEEFHDALNAKDAEITVEEVQQIAKSLSAQADGELDEDALENVAGGVDLGFLISNASEIMRSGRNMGAQPVNRPRAPHWW